MVVGEVGLQDPVQVLLTEDNDVIEAFSMDGAHEAFGIWVLPGRTRGRENFLDADALDATLELLAVDSITVPDHTAGRRILGKRLNDLLASPPRARKLGAMDGSCMKVGSHGQTDH